MVYGFSTLENIESVTNKLIISFLFSFIFIGCEYFFVLHFVLINKLFCSVDVRGSKANEPPVLNTKLGDLFE